MLRINALRAVTKNHNSERLEVCQVGMSRCFTWIPPRSSTVGRDRSCCTSMIETSNPSFMIVVAERIARTSLSASLRTCMHTLMGVFAVTASLNGILFKIQVLLQLLVYDFDLAVSQVKQGIHR